jgi:hypothetical protein
MPRGRPKVPRIKVQCAWCGTEIEKYPQQVEQNKSGRFFCSQEHRAKAGKPRTVEPKPCEQCGKEFVSYGKKTKGTGRFCSKDCFDTWQRRNRVERTCKQCGKTFTRSASFETRQVARFCSRKCEAESRIKRPLDRMHNGKPAVLDRNGYVRVYEPDHPRATKAGWQFEHRLIVEQRLGRYLERHEHVHHVNGKKDDNRPENLIVMDELEHLILSGSDYRAETTAALAELAEYRRRYGSLDA